MKLQTLALLTMTGALLAIAPSAPAAEPSNRAGHIPNPFTDSRADEPLRKAGDVFDVYQTMVAWLKEAWPRSGKAAEAITAMEGYVARARQAAADPQAPAAEMPVNIDQFMRFLRADAPGSGGRKWPEALRKNPKAQLYTAALLPLLHARGLTFRLRPLAERSYHLHTMAIGALRQAKQQLELRSGTSGLALFHFFTYPMVQKGRGKLQFHSATEAQTWIEGEALPTLDVAIEMAEGAYASFPEGHQESVDHTIFLESDQPYPDAGMELPFRYFSRPEVANFVGRLYGARAWLHLLAAYQLDDVAAVSNALRQRLTATFFKEKVSLGKKPRVGITSKLRFSVMDEFPAFLTLRDAGHTKAALADLRTAWGFLDTAMRGYFQAQPGDKDDRVVNLRWIHATWKEYQNKLAPQVRAALAGPTTLTDYRGGASVDVDLPGFLTAPPRDLKSFFPARFDETSPFRAFKFPSEQILYTNYDYGNPTSWKLDAAGDAWGKFFPTIDTSPDAAGNWKAPLSAVRDLSRTYAGAWVVGFFNLFTN